jgi:hypothetical protein
VNPETDAQKEMHWRAVDRRKKGWERGVAAKVGERFASEAQAVVGAVAGGSFDVETVIDSQAGAWEELFTAVYRAIIEDFGRETVKDITGRALESREFDPWGDSVKAWVKRRGADAVEDIKKTTKKAVRKVLVDGLDEGWDMRRIAKAIGEKYATWEGGTGAYRAMLIARTEVHAAASYGAHESARQSGVVDEKAWLSSFDPPRAREDHMAISNQWIPFDQPFRMPDGAEIDHPGEGPAEHVVNCRCVEMFRSR